MANSLPEFKIFTGALKSAKSPDGRMRLHGVASSTARDLHGDVMLPSAIEDMVRGASNGMTVFLNHSYNVPEDVAGSVEKASLSTRGVDQDANPKIDLNFDILVNDANPRAVSAFEAVNRGSRLGISIGAMIPKDGATRNKDGTFVIHHVDLMEASLVGIPANPYSFVEYAVKSLRRAEAEQNPSTDEVIEEIDVSGIDAADYLSYNSSTGVTTTTGWSENTTIGGTTTTPTVLQWTPAPFEVVTEPEVLESLQPDIEEAACPTCGKRHNSSCSDSYHKSVEETDISEATVVIQVDARDGDAPAPSSQDAPTSQPESGDGLLDETADGDDAALGDNVTRSIDATDVQSMLDFLRTTTSELVEAKKTIVDLESRIGQAEKERDAALESQRLVLAETKNTLDRLADTPLMRRAPVIAAQKSLRQNLKGIYDQDFLAMLENKND